MSNLNNLIIKEFREHQKKRPDEPTESHPSWVHQQYEAWQRENEALQLILGVRLVQDALNEKTETPLPTRDEIKKVLQREFGSFLAHNPANPARFWGQSADAVLALLKGEKA